MKITIRELKQLIREQLEEAGELAAAAKGAPIRHSKSEVDNQGMPPVQGKQAAPPAGANPQEKTIAEELEEQAQECSTSMAPGAIQESIRKLVREAIRQHLISEKRKGLPPWLKPGFKKDEDKTSKKETDEKDEEDDKEKLEENTLNLIKEAIKQALNEKAKSDPKWLSKAGKEIAKKGTKGALHKDLGVSKDKKIPVATLNKKKAALQKKGEGDKKMSAEDRKELRRVQFAINAKKAKK